MVGSESIVHGFWVHVCRRNSSICLFVSPLAILISWKEQGGAFPLENALTSKRLDFPHSKTCLKSMETAGSSVAFFGDEQRMFATRWDGAGVNKNYVACHMASNVLAYAANNLIWKNNGLRSRAKTEVWMISLALLHGICELCLNIQNKLEIYC